MSNKVISIKGKMSYKKYIQLFTSFYNLSEKEIDVLATFLEVNDELVNQKIDINVFSAIGKKEVASRLKIKDFNTLNNYIKRLKDKGILLPAPLGYDFMELFLNVKCETLTLKFVW